MSAIVKKSDINKVIRLRRYFRLDIEPQKDGTFLVTLGERR